MVPKLIVLVSLISIWSNLCFAQSNAPASVALSPEQKRFIDAQTQNEQAQAAYYRQQVKPADTGPPPPQGFFAKLKENPNMAVSILCSLVAALVALTTFSFNYRSTLRGQRDTRFYEALQRLGQGSSAPLRFSAVGLLRQMANERRWTPALRWPMFRWDYPYRDTALGQFIGSMLLEDSTEVLLAITYALRGLMSAHPKQLIELLARANIELQDQMVSAIARVCATSEVDVAMDDDTDDEQVWETAAALTPFKVDVVTALIRREKWANRFIDMYNAFRRVWNISTTGTRESSWAKMLTPLLEASDRMKANMDVLTYALANHPSPAGHQLDDVFLVGVKLDNADFRRASLTGAQLQYCSFDAADFMEANLESTIIEHCHFTQASFEDANLSFASFEDVAFQGVNFRNTRLYGIVTTDKQPLVTEKWWKADFTGKSQDSEPVKVDTSLLTDLSEQSNGMVPVPPAHMHPSVREFLEEARR